MMLYRCTTGSASFGSAPMIMFSIVLYIPVAYFSLSFLDQAYAYRILKTTMPLSRALGVGLVDSTVALLYAARRAAGNYSKGKSARTL
jgi:hypothetical protein